ncbi:MAG: carbohydrate binding domain-containing protein, partial [Anaerolineales bacterium]
MKKAFLNILLITMMLISSVSTAVAASARNMSSVATQSQQAAGSIVVSNVNFNDSTTGSWTQSGGPTLAYVDDGQGGQALSITRSADYEGIQSPTGLLDAGIEYTFSMRAMLAAGGPASTDIRFVVKPNYNWVANTTINATGWTTISGVYTLPAGVDPATAQIYIGSTDQTGPYTILIDDILITRPAAVVTVSSVNFNDSTTGAWTQSGGPTLAYVDDGNGGQALSITRAADYEGIQSPTSLLAAGVEYTFSMRAMLAAGGPASTDIRFVVKPNYNWVANATINATGWTTLSGVYTLPAGVDPATAQIYIGSADQTGPYTILIDDILITTPDTGGGGTGILDSDCSNGYVALTFDDGPYAGQTDHLIAALDAAHLRATFFDWGQHISGNASLVQAQFANGWVGNHSWTHSDMTTLTQEQITTELTDTQNALQAITGQAPVLFRPPYLASNATLKAVEASLGLTEIMADVDSKDWTGASTATIITNVSTARDGATVLMHDNLPTTRAAIPRIADFMTNLKLCPGMINPATGHAVAPPAQVAINTDFENGLDGWVARNAQGTPTVDLTTDQSHSPTHAALVSNRTGQGDGIGHDATGIMKPGTTYIITAWVRMASGSDSIWLSMRRTNAGTDTYDTIG